MSNSKEMTSERTGTLRKAWTLAAIVGDRVYSPLIDRDPTKVGDYPDVYRGHFRSCANERESSGY